MLKRLIPFNQRELTVLGLLGAGHLLSHFYILVLPPLFPLLKGEFDVTFVALGMLVTLNSLVTSVAQTPFGFLVDRFDSRKILVAGLVFQGCMIGAIGFTDSYLAALALFGLAGIANAVFHPVDYAILSGSIARDRVGQAFSIHTFTGNIGWVIAPGTVLALTALWNWRTAIVIVAGAAFVVAALIVWQRHKLREEESAPRSGDEASPNPHSTRAGLALLMRPTILMAFLFFALIPMSFGAIRVFSVSALVALYGYSLTAANVALTVFLIGTSCGILFGGLFVDRLNRPQAMAGGGFLGGAIFVALVGAIALPFAVVVAAIGAAGFCAGVVQPARDLLIRKVTPAGAAGKVFGFVSTGIGVGGAIMPMVFGLILDFGDPRAVFWLAGIFFLVGLVTVSRFATIGKRVWSTGESGAG